MLDQCSFGVALVTHAERLNSWYHSQQRPCTVDPQDHVNPNLKSKDQIKNLGAEVMFCTYIEMSGSNVVCSPSNKNLMKFCTCTNFCCKTYLKINQG